LCVVGIAKLSHGDNVGRAYTVMYVVINSHFNMFIFGITFSLRHNLAHSFSHFSWRSCFECKHDEITYRKQIERNSLTAMKK